MALINPVHGLVVSFLCLCTIPLAIFAGITTTLAFSILMFRVAVVYVDIALSMIPQYFRGGRSRPRVNDTPSTPHPRRSSRQSIALSPTGSASGGSGYSSPSSITAFPTYSFPAYPPPPSTGGHRSPFRRKSSYGFGGTARHSRRSSQVSLASLGTITPIREGCVTPTAGYGESGGITPSAGIDRDFEGIGGWRLDDQDDDANWTNINSRLELPLERSSFSTRHHQRSQSAGPTTPSEVTWLMMKSPSISGGPSVTEKDPIVTNTAFAMPNARRQRSSQSLKINTAVARVEQENSGGYFSAFISPKNMKKASVAF
ncbi:hypothetical protein V8F33_009374 [Rhypophila sp. PSN 637]